MAPTGQIYPRQFMEGVFLPREDIGGWCVEIGQERFTQDAPGPVHQVDIELDANGCLTTGTISLKKPRHPVFPAYTFTAAFWLLSRSRGWVPVGQGYIPPATEDGREEFSLPVRPLEDLSMKDYFDGSLAGATGQMAEAGKWTQKNEEVVSEALKNRPKASIGVDWAGRVVLAEPSQGQPVHVNQRLFYDWKSTGHVTLPYATRSRWDGGAGWLKGEYHGIARPPLAERRAIDAGEVTFIEVVRDSGPPVVTIAELTVNARTAPTQLDEFAYLVPDVLNEGQPVPMPEEDPATSTQQQPIGTTPPARLLKRTVTAQQYAVVHVYDLGAWYEGSSLPGQGDSDLLKQLQEAVTSAQEAFRMSFDVLGEANDFTQEERLKLEYAQNKLRLARVSDPSRVSDYEPLSAKLSTGFVLDVLFWNEYRQPTESGGL